MNFDDQTGPGHQKSKFDKVPKELKKNADEGEAAKAPVTRVVNSEENNNVGENFSPEVVDPKM